MNKQIKAVKDHRVLKEVKNIERKFKEIDAYIDKNVNPKDKQSSLMGVLHKVQETFDYIPKEAMEHISEKLSVPTAHIYGMATFYNLFSLKPKAKYKIAMCKGTACYVSGSARILAKVKDELKIEEGDISKDGLFSLDITRCLGCCGLSPVMQVNKDIYVRMSPEKVPAILKKYRELDKKIDKKPKK